MSNKSGQAWMLGMLLLFIAAVVLGVAYLLFANSGMELTGFSVFNGASGSDYAKQHPLAITGLVLVAIIGMFIYESSTSGRVSGFM